MAIRRYFNKTVVVLVMISTIICTYTVKGQASTANLDVNKDSVVDMQDLETAKQYYNTTNSLYDVNGDGLVDLFDFSLISKGFDEQFADNGYYSIGNRQSNLLNSSLEASAGGYIYFQNTQDGNKLYMEKLNRENRKKLTEDAVSSINVIGTKVYYKNLSDGNKIYSVNVDGSGRTAVLNESVDDFAVSGGYIYYIASSDKSLYRITQDGGNKLTVRGGSVYKFTVYGTDILYTDSSQGDKLCKVSRDGSDTKVLTSTGVYTFAVENKVIYYIDSSDYKIYSIGIDGSNSKKISDFSASQINVDDGVIYYSSKSDGSLCKINIDGSGWTSIGGEKLPVDGSKARLLVDDGYIYYTNVSDEGRLYRIAADGSDKEDMETVITGIAQVSDWVSLRTGPSTSYSRITTIPRHAEMQVIDRTTTSGSTWYKVLYNENGTVFTGYVSAYYVLVVDDDRMNNHLGVLSEKYESNGDPGNISNNSSDLGGKSYGAWQLATNTGSLATFFDWLQGENPDFYAKLNAGWVADGNTNGTNFDAAWKDLALNHYNEFYEVQHKYIKMMYYDKTVAAVKKNFNIDINTKSFAYRNAVWSTAVQHGVGGATSLTKPGVLTAVYGQNPVDDSDFISKVYAQRSKTDIYFSSYDQNSTIIANIKQRYVSECADAQDMYSYYMNDF